MKYDEKWPDAKEWEEFNENGSFIIRTIYEYKCWVCGAPAHWTEGSFQVAMCSEECAKSVWDSYIKHVS